MGGFRCDFTFRIIRDNAVSNPGPCKLAHHSPESCSRRGGDGFAFVVQNNGLNSLGIGGGGLGYSGIPNAVAIELDTWFDAPLRDPYDNHVAVLTRGKSQLRSGHSTHVGVCLDIPDLADGEQHSIRLEYDPVFHAEIAAHPSFQAGPHLFHLVFPAAAGVKHGLGSLRVYLDEMLSPVLIVPMSFDYFMDLDGGAAWVGFTASTGDSYQNHDILSWSFFESGQKADSFGAGNL